jgi:hypothetical protein
MFCVSAVFAVAALMPAGLMADPILYTFTWGEGILQVMDASSTNPPTTIGPMGFQAKFGGLAYDTFNNTMYMVDGTGDDVTTSHSSLYSVNLVTGAATLIGSTGLPAELTGITYDSANNTLYGAQDIAGAPLVTLNTSTGAATAVGSGIAAGEVDNVAFDSTNGVLYGWADCLGCAALYSVDTTTGVGTLLNGTGLDSNDSQLVYDPGTNLLWDLDVRGILSTIDPSAFTQSVVVGGPTINTESSGLALIPGASTATPEPSTIVLIGTGMAMLVARLKRKAR